MPLRDFQDGDVFDRTRAGRAHAVIRRPRWARGDRLYYKIKDLGVAFPATEAEFTSRYVRR